RLGSLTVGARSLAERGRDAVAGPAAGRFGLWGTGSRQMSLEARRRGFVSGRILAGCRAFPPALDTVNRCKQDWQGGKSFPVNRLRLPDAAMGSFLTNRGAGIRQGFRSGFGAWASGGRRNFPNPPRQFPARSSVARRWRERG